MFESTQRTALLPLMGVAFLAVALFASAAQAQTPNPGYEQFRGCPTVAQNASIEVCLRSDVTGGHLQMGSKDVPIKKPMKITGGLDGGLENFSANSEGGLALVKQEVPGGVIGLTGLDWLINFLSLEALKLYAQTELAGIPSNFPEVTTLTLPIKAKLINPVLGNNCYVGSNSNPIVLNITTETTSPPPPNEPITGVFPEASVEPEREIVQLMNGIYVDNEFAAPGASGCVLTLFGFIPISINGLVNSQSGLPSPAGTNETIQEIDIELAERSLVY